MLQRFVAEYSQRAYRFAFGLCGNEDDARELVQEAFFRLARDWDRYDPGQPLEAYYLAILKNVFIDGRRRCDRRRLVPLSAPVEDAEGSTLADVLADPRDPAPPERLERQWLRERVGDVLASLTLEHRAILTLCDMEGLEYDEIARVLDIPAGTVRSRLSRARAAFRAVASDRYKEEVAEYAVS